MPNFDLLRRAAEIVDGVPDERLDLDVIIRGAPSPHACGTTACAMGLLAMHPEFRARGLGWDASRTGFGAWEGHAHCCAACDQGRKPCQSPDACQMPVPVARRARALFWRGYVILLAAIVAGLWMWFGVIGGAK